MTRPANARIAINRPIRRLFDYSVPAHLQLEPGQRVRVPFGRLQLTGLVVETGVTPPEGIALKPVIEALETWPALPAETLNLLSWAADYYQYPLGECLFMALPPALRRGQPAREKPDERWQLADAGAELPANAKRQIALREQVRQQPGVSTSELIRQGFTRAQLRTLEAKGILTETRTTIVGPPATGRLDQPALSAPQQAAAEALPESTDRFSATLLYGITGSGKTEMYLHFLKQRLADDDQALVMVPEINLTPQTLARFRRYFGDRIAVWHSALNDSERLQTWLDIRRGKPTILIGTRSAVLLPFTRLRTIVVDEEHDSSYKQGEGFRYSGRDLAVYRAHLNRCPVILGSATPSLESWHNAMTGKYRMVRLEQRAGTAQPPTLELLDIRSRPLESGLSRPALAAVKETLARGEQALVFVNRRGFAPVVMCFDCGHFEECPRCDTRLT
ncbi:MAG: primosomal protein N', partial [Marinobacter sp. 34-60-7]